MRTASFSQFVTRIETKTGSPSPEDDKNNDRRLDDTDQQIHDADLAVEMARYVREMKAVCSNTPDDLKQETSPICKEESTVESTDRDDDVSPEAVVCKHHVEQHRLQGRLPSEAKQFKDVIQYPR